MTSKWILRWVVVAVLFGGGGAIWKIQGLEKAKPASPASGVESSGTTSSGIAAAGNICPPLGDLFSSSLYWAEFARDIRGDAKDAYSDHIIELWSSHNPKLHIDFSATGKWTFATGTYGIPINVVPDSHPLFPVTYTAFNAESDSGPVPMVARGAFEGTRPDTLPPMDAPKGDRHHIVLVRDSTGKIATEWDIYQPITNDGGETWTAACGARFDLISGNPRPVDWTSGDAAGMPIAPLLLRYEDVARGDVGHAIRATFPAEIIYGRYIHPARHAAMASANIYGLCFGARMRLTQQWYDENIFRFGGQARVILEAMRNYGIINADITGSGLRRGAFIGGVTDDRWDADSTTHGIFALEKVPMNAFEVVEQHAGWTIEGPNRVKAGQTATFTISRYPLWDKNFSGSVYIHVNGKLEPIGSSSASVTLTDRHAITTWRFKTDARGTYEIKGSHGNQSWKDAAPIMLTVD